MHWDLGAGAPAAGMPDAAITNILNGTVFRRVAAHTGHTALYCYCYCCVVQDLNAL